jgi:hypothetical protein
MDPVVARKMWRTLEPYHGAIYFAPEGAEAYAALGITDRMMGYFGSRSAPMGAVPAEVVIATFYNFNPQLVKQAIPKVWSIVTPTQILAARLDVADKFLRRTIGETDTAEAAGLAREAAEVCRPEGRPLFAGHASLPWPDEPHLVLWHAITLLREFRGDGHLIALAEAGLDGCEALVTHAAAGDVPDAVLRSSRSWPTDDWEAAVDRLRTRGLVDASGSFTPEGHELRQRIEDTTDRLALAPWQELGEERCTQLRALVRPFSRAIVESGELTFGN